MDIKNRNVPNDPHEKKEKNLTIYSFYIQLTFLQQIFVDCLLGARHYTVIALEKYPVQHGDRHINNYNSICYLL